MVVREKGKNKTTYGCITSICVFLDACFPGFHIHLNLDHGYLVKQSKSRTPSVKEAVHSHHKERKKKTVFLSQIWFQRLWVTSGWPSMCFLYLGEVHNARIWKKSRLPCTSLHMNMVCDTKYLVNSWEIVTKVDFLMIQFLQVLFPSKIKAV